MMFATFFMFLLLWIVVFGICGAVAAFVGPPPDRIRWFVLTVFFLGPVGVGFAAVAPAHLRKQSDAWQYACERCGEFQNVAHGTKSADCWRCGDRLF